MKQTINFNTSDLTTLADFGLGFAKSQMEKRGEVPTAFMFDNNGEPEIFPTPWGNDREKNTYLSFMSLTLKEIGSKQYIFMTEAWVAHVSPDTPKEIASLRPAQRLDRDEVIFIVAASKDAFVVKSVKIVRNDNTIGFEDFMPGSSDHMEGRLLDLLKDEPSKPITTETVQERLKK